MYKMYTKNATLSFSTNTDTEMAEDMVLESLNALATPANAALLQILDKAGQVYTTIDSATFPAFITFPKLSTSGNAPTYSQYVIPRFWSLRIVTTGGQVTYGWVMRSLNDHPGEAGGR